jgi:hypothetical protein
VPPVPQLAVNAELQLPAEPPHAVSASIARAENHRSLRILFT